MPETVLVTGSSSGFGLAIARRFAERGWNVAATACDPSGLGDWARGERVLPLPLDVTDEASVATAVAATLQRFAAIMPDAMWRSMVGEGKRRHPDRTRSRKRQPSR